jgi:hypothetical protein
VKKLSPYWPLRLAFVAGGSYLAWTVYVLLAGSPTELAVWRIFDSCVAGFMGIMYLIFLTRTAKRRRQADEAIEQALAARLDYEECSAESNRARRYYLDAMDRHMRRLGLRTEAEIIDESARMAAEMNEQSPAGWAPIEPIHPETIWESSWATHLPPGNAVPQ